MPGEIHMPCGCPYPRLGDRRPCEHGYSGEDEELEGEIIPPGERREEIPYPDCPGPPPPPPAAPRSRRSLGVLPEGPPKGGPDLR